MFLIDDTQTTVGLPAPAAAKPVQYRGEMCHYTTAYIPHPTRTQGDTPQPRSITANRSTPGYSSPNDSTSNPNAR